MSVIISVKISGDSDVLTNALRERADEFAKAAERARAGGAIHHRFGAGEGFVLVVDEWESAEQFQKFFGDPDLQAFIGSAGADLSVPPEVTIATALSSVDQF